MQTTNNKRNIKNSSASNLAMPSKSNTISNESVNSDYYLGSIPSKYIRSTAGLIHGLASLGSLILGNMIFFTTVALGRPTGINGGLSPLAKAFCGCTFISSAVTRTFFWNMVQNWQLATTSTKDKGVTPSDLKRFNQGRGVVTTFLNCIYPIIVTIVPSPWLEDAAFSTFVACLLCGLIVYAYTLIRGYKKPILIWLYGMYHAGLAAAILSYGTIAKLQHQFPTLVSYHVIGEASFIVSCIQWGFLWYYAYSRKLVSKKTVQTLCKTYHPMMLVIMAMRRSSDMLSLGLKLEKDRAEYHDTSSFRPPLQMLPHATIYSLLLFGLVLKVAFLMGKKMHQMLDRKK